MLAAAIAAGATEDGSFYYAMELREGCDADTLVRRFGPIPAGLVAHLLRQVCHSLSEAESCGLVHRDIKPANILLCRYGEDYDFMKVDFGHWLLTGQLVFTADTAMGLLLHHAPTAPAPPSARTELPIPPAMERLVLACLVRDPAARPQSAKELSRLLSEVDGGAWTGDHARDWWIRHHPAQAAAGTSRGEA